MRKEPGAPPRGYSIPTIDLAYETARQVIVDRERNLYLGHPTTVLLEDQRTLIAVYPKGHGRGAIVYKRSTDGGRTWSDRLPTPAPRPSPAARVRGNLWDRLCCRARSRCTSRD